MSDKKVKYMEIYEYFRDKIKKGEIKPDEKLPTEYEIVDMFSVSRHTVRQSILELERNGLIYREKGRGAFCTDINKKEVIENKIVLVITTYLSDYIFPYIIRGIEETLSKEGYNILLLSTNNQKERETEQLEKLLNYDIAGAIIEPTASALNNVNEEYYVRINKRNIPYVMINSKYNDLTKAFVTMDDELGGYLQTKHLIDNGHTRIAGIFKEDDMQGINRKKGYLKALKESNIDPDYTILGAYKTFEEKFYPSAFIGNILTLNNRPTAIVCYNDKIALDVIVEARKLGIKIPEELSIIGYDNAEFITAALDFGLTSVNHPKEILGKQAAEMLIKLINKEETNTEVVIKPEIVVRDSTYKK